MTGGDLGEPPHGSLLVDRHAGTLGCLAESPDVPAYVETGAPRLHHSAVEGVRSDLATQLGLRDQLCLQSQAGVQQLVGPFEPSVVRWLGREVQLAGACEVAVDVFVCHQLLDKADRL